MNYTAKELRQIADAMDAEKQGRKVQYIWTNRNGDDWTDCATPIIGLSENSRDGRRVYRPKPEPKVRPWSKQSDFPFGGAVRHKTQPEVLYFPANVQQDGIELTFNKIPYLMTWLALADYYEVTTNGKDFAPCTVTEP